MLERSLPGRTAAPADPHGFAGLGIVLGTLLFHFLLPLGPEGTLVSRTSWVEVLAHAWLLLAPPFALWLGFRRLVLDGRSPVPLVTVPLAFLLTLLTWAGVTLAVLG